MLGRKKRDFLSHSNNAAVSLPRGNEKKKKNNNVACPKQFILFLAIMNRYAGKAILLHYSLKRILPCSGEPHQIKTKVKR